MRLRFRKTAAAAAIAGSLAIALVVAPSFGAPSDGLKKPPTAQLKNFEIEQLAQGFSEPTSLDWLPDETLLVTERTGKLWAVSPDGIKRLVVDISDHVALARERGFGTVEVAADYATSRRVYLSYTFLVKPDKPDGPQAMRLSYIRFDADGNLINPAAPETVVLGKDASSPCPPISNKLDCPPSVNATHQAGNVISLNDGTLFISFGDSNLPSNPGKQTLRTLNPASTAGKILHIDPEGRGLPDHPFCRKDDNLNHTCTKIWARGFRNPYRFAVSGKGAPIVADVGWNSQEEISLAEKGKNYGWPCYEGRIRTPFYEELAACRKLYASRKKARVGGPFYSYGHPKEGAGAAIIAGPVYPGGLYPKEFNGSQFVGDYTQGFIKRLVKTKKHGVKAIPIAYGVTPVDLQLAPDGNLAFVDYRRGTVRELVYAPANKAPVPSLAAAPTSGLAPLDVAFNAAASTDPNGNTLAFDWDFGDGSAHSNSVAPSHVYTANGTYNVKLTVTDGIGGTAFSRTTITVGNNAPTATILRPTATTFSAGGQPTQLLAQGSDPEDGDLPDSAFGWNVVLHHNDHVHPESLSTGRSSQFTGVRDHDADSYYEVILTVTDSQGLKTTLPSVNVMPAVVKLRLGTNLKGIKLGYGGRDLKAPRRFDAAIGYFANLSAPATVTRGGVTYSFKKWSQGGKRAQIYEVPARASRVRAIYKPG